jgi:hypothetical protein
MDCLSFQTLQAAQRGAKCLEWAALPTQNRILEVTVRHLCITPRKSVLLFDTGIVLSISLVSVLVHWAKSDSNARFIARSSAFQMPTCRPSLQGGWNLTARGVTIIEQCTHKSTQPSNVGRAEAPIGADVAATPLAVSSSKPASFAEAPASPAAPLITASSAPHSDAATFFSFDFSRFSSAVELESIGAESLKNVLASAGLKCGGTLSQRAERLFLLKTTPRNELNKKHFAQ